MLKHYTIYTLPNCSTCHAVMRQWDKEGVVYEEIDLASHPELRQELKDLGVKAAPLVKEVDGDVVTQWWGPKRVPIM